jgi:hypothetical protein
MKPKTAARSLFFDDWQACLRAHYVYVIRTNDRVTEPSLRQVLLQSGLSENDLEALRQQAYAPAPGEDPEEVEPEEIAVAEELAGPTPVEEAPAADPDEPTFDDLGVVVETGSDEIAPEEEPAVEESDQEDEPPPDFGRQLSLF